MSLPLSPAMRIALQYLNAASEASHDPHGVAANTLASPYHMDGQVWMDWRTAEALERRGLVRVVDGTDVYLPGGVARSGDTTTYLDRLTFESKGPVETTKPKPRRAHRLSPRAPSSPAGGDPGTGET